LNNWLDGRTLAVYILCNHRDRMYSDADAFVIKLNHHANVPKKAGAYRKASVFVSDGDSNITWTCFSSRYSCLNKRRRNHFYFRGKAIPKRNLRTLLKTASINCDNRPTPKTGNGRTHALD
jgi:hypothetical protein